MDSNPDNGATETRKLNEAKLAGLYEEYYDKIAHYVYTHIGDKNEAENIAGEVFLKALESLKSYRELGIPMQAWLCLISREGLSGYICSRSYVKKSINRMYLDYEGGEKGVLVIANPHAPRVSPSEPFLL